MIDTLVIPDRLQKQIFDCKNYRIEFVKPLFHHENAFSLPETFTEVFSLAYFIEIAIESSQNNFEKF